MANFPIDDDDDELAPPLSEQIERLSDTRDSDLGDHLRLFFRNFRQSVALGDFNLLSKENAEDALRSVGEAVDRLNSQLRLVQSLKRLLEEQRAELQK